MDFSTIAGLTMGLVILALALLLGHVPPATLFNPEALLIVFGGTLTATLVGFNQRVLGRAFLSLFGGGAESRMDTANAVQYAMDVVLFVRDEGILALQPILDSIEIPFFRKGLTLVLDNRPEKFVRESLATEMEVAYRESLEYSRVFETAGGFAPTMGIIGAVIGLIYVVQTFHDPALLGKGVANAFSATLYGVALSNLFLLPLAGRLRQRAQNEWYIRTLLLEAILSIRSGEHPMLVEERLNAFSSALHGEELEAPVRRSKGKSYGSAPHGTLSSSAVMQDDFLQVNDYNGAMH